MGTLEVWSAWINDLKIDVIMDMNHPLSFKINSLNIREQFKKLKQWEVPGGDKLLKLSVANTSKVHETNWNAARCKRMVWSCNVRLTARFRAEVLEGPKCVAFEREHGKSKDMLKQERGAWVPKVQCVLLAIDIGNFVSKYQFSTKKA